MVYRGKVQQGFILFFFIMTLGLFILNFSTSNFPKEALYFQVITLLFMLFSLFIRYQFEIKDGYLIYQFLFLRKTLYKRIIYPNQIKKIKFVRYGWATKGAIVQIKNQLSIRIYRLEPKNVLLDLYEFATKNSVSTVKTKDYLILERMK